MVHPVHNLLAEVALEDSALAVHWEESAVPVDIDKASFGKALTDFEHCQVRASPVRLAVDMAGQVAWDRTDYYIDLAWSILFSICYQ